MRSLAALLDSRRLDVPAGDTGRGAGRGRGDRSCTPTRHFEARKIIRADHAAARGQRDGLHHTGEFDSNELGAKWTAQIHPPYRGDGQPDRPKCRAGKILASGDSGRGWIVVRKPDGGGGLVRDFHRGVVGGDDPRDGSVSMSGDDVRDDRLGVRELDPEPIPDAGDQRVLPLARDEHLDAEIARRLQVGVDPVAAGRGDQQDPSRGVPPRLGIRRRPQPQPPPPAMPHAPQVPAPPVAWNTLLNTKVEPVSRVTKSISAPRR